MGQTVLHKDCSFEIKAISEEGDFEGYLSTWDVDLMNDKVWPGAFKKTLRENKDFPFLYQHDTWSPVGSFTGKEDETGLYIKGRLNLELTAGGQIKVPKAHEAHSLMKMKNLSKLSMGYDAVKWDREEIKKVNIRNLREVRLWEGSVVTFAGNPNADITDVKNVSVNTMLLVRDIKKVIERGEITKKQLLALFENEPTDVVSRELESLDIGESVSINHYPKTREEIKNLMEVLNDR